MFITFFFPSAPFDLGYGGVGELCISYLRISFCGELLLIACRRAAASLSGIFLGCGYIILLLAGGARRERGESWWGGGKLPHFTFRPGRNAKRLFSIMTRLHYQPLRRGGVFPPVFLFDRLSVHFWRRTSKGGFLSLWTGHRGAFSGWVISAER